MDFVHDYLAEGRLLPSVLVREERAGMQGRAAQTTT
jgi:hypothetical protein